MITFENYSESASGCSFTLAFAYGSVDPVRELVDKSTKAEAMDRFLTLALDALKFRVDDFKAAMHIVKPHYFDSRARPYLSQDNRWRAAYWRLFDLNVTLERLRDDGYTYCRQLRECLPVLLALVPELHQLGHIEIKAMYKDIEKTVNQIVKIVNERSAENLNQDRQKELCVHVETNTNPTI